MFLLTDLLVCDTILAENALGTYGRRSIMSIHWDETGRRYVVRFRDCSKKNRVVTVNLKNLLRYGQHVPDRITVRVAKRLEEAILACETAVDGSIRSAERRQLLWFDVVARYLPSIELCHS